MREIPKTLIVGLGGTGKLAIKEIKRMMLEKGYIEPGLSFPLVKFLEIDTEFMSENGEKVKIKKGEEEGGDFSYEKELDALDQLNPQPDEKIDLSFNKKDMVDVLNKPSIVGAEDFVVGAEHLSEVCDAVRGNGAGGMGLVGKLSLWRRLADVKEIIDVKVSNLNNLEHLVMNPAYSEKYKCPDESKRMNIFVICSLGGGTGKGLFLPIGAMLKKAVYKQLKNEESNVNHYLINFLPSCFTVAGRRVNEGYRKTLLANQYASFKELNNALENGYPVEKSIKSLYHQSQEDYINGIFDKVINVGSQLQLSYQHLGNYMTINQAVANFVVTMTFEEVDAQYRAEFSNMGAFNQTNQIMDNVTGAVRKDRYYGRIGSYTAKYPVARLFNYAKNYFMKEILEDIALGDLNPVDQGRRVKPADLGRKIKEIFDAKVALAYMNSELLSMNSLNNRYTSFSEPWIAGIQNFVTEVHGSNKGFSDNLPQTWRNIVKSIMTGDDMNVIGGDSLGNINVLFKEFVKNYGIEFLVNAVDDFKRTLAVDYFNEYHHEVEDLILKGDLPETFDFSERFADLIENLKEDFKRKFEESLEKLQEVSIKNDFYADIKQSLREDEADWKKRLHFFKRLFVGLGLSQKPSDGISYKTENSIEAVIRKINQCINETSYFLKTYSKLKILLDLYEALNERKALLEQNSEALLQRAKYYEMKNNNVIRDASGPLEFCVIDETHDEFTKFAQSLVVNAQKVTDYIQGIINRNLIYHVTKDTVDLQLIEEQVSGYINEIDVLRKNYSIVKWMRDKEMEPGGEEILKIIIHKLTTNASYLGIVDQSTIRPENSGSFSYQFCLMSSDDKSYIQHLFSKVNNDAQMRFSFGSSPEDICLMNIETELVIPMFKELQEGNEIYNKLVRSRSISALALRHTSPVYFDIPEPIGAIVQLDYQDIIAFVNLLVHSGCIYAEDDFFVKVRKKDGDKYYIVPDGRKDVPDEEKMITIGNLIADLNKHNKWYEDFLDRLTQQWIRLFTIRNEEVKEKALNEFRNYFIYNDKLEDKQYPIVPPVILKYILKSAEEDANMAGRTLLGFFKENKLEHYNRNKIKSLSKRNDEIRSCKNEKDLKKYYTLFPIHEYLREETQDNPYWVQWGDGENKQSGSLTLSQIMDIVKSNKSLEVLEGDTGWKKWEDHPELRKLILKALKS